MSVEIVRGKGVRRKRARVGNDCRLRLRVPLGPGNPDQQYSPQARVRGLEKSVETIGLAPSVSEGTAVYTTRVRIHRRAGGGCHRAGDW